MESQVRIYQPCIQCAAINDHGQVCQRCERIAQQAARIVALENALRGLTGIMHTYHTGTHITLLDVIAEIHRAEQVLAGRGVDAPKDGDHEH